ncbi:MAG: sensor domain-containing protein, partial [Propionibacteriaceae bacterium]|nr:sensor domain-containing protein [Propionibacteriaceae bacterium]
MSTTMISLPARTGLVSRWSKALAGHLLSWVLSFAVWVATVCLLSVGVGTLIIWVGVPVIALTLLLAHGYAEAKKRLATWQGEPLWEDLPKVQATTATRRRGPFAAVGA